MTDPISSTAYRLAVGKLLLANFAHWERMPPAEFVEKKVRMPGEHGSTRPWRFDFFPPQKEMFNEIFNPRNREVVFKMASRLTKTMTVLGAIGYCIAESPRKSLVMWPKIGDSEEWSKKHLMGELVEPSESLQGLLQDGRGRRLANNTILSKIFPGGYISMFGANVPGDFRRAKGNFLYADEIDAIAIAESDEGDQLRQFAVRGSEYPDTVQVYCSYPSLKGQSNIDSKYDLSDKRVWETHCLKCGDPWVMHRKDLDYDKENTESAVIQCPNCHAYHDDTARYAMSRGGDANKPRFDLWSAGADFKGIAGFHANALLWPHPVDRQKYPGGFLQMLALEEIAVDQADNPERARRVLVNTRDAESYEPEHLQKIEHSVLYKRREKYDPREVLPAEVVFITGGCDLQSNRAEIKFKGWGFSNLSGGVESRHAESSGTQEIQLYDKIGQLNPSRDESLGQCARPSRGQPGNDLGSGSSAPPAQNLIVKQSWAIDYRIVRGSPLQAEFWEKLQAVFQNVAWKHPSGKWIHPSIILFDSRFRPDEVFSFTRRMQRLRIYACEGSTTISKPIVPKKPIKRGVPPALVWEIGTHEAKDVIYQQLELSDPSAQGFCHFPETASFNEGYFKGLTIEESVTQRGRDGGFYRFFFKKSSDDRNEPLDCFSEDTEILTEKGWKYFYQLSDERLATVNLKTDEIEYDYPTALIEREYEGEMIHLKGVRMDIMVTPDHRMVSFKKELKTICKGMRKWNFDVPVKITLAKDLTIHHQLKMTGRWIGYNPVAIEIPASISKQGREIEPARQVDPHLIAKLIGWYVSEGSLFRGISKTQGNLRHRVAISQVKEENVALISDLTGQLPWKWRYEGHQFICTSKQLFDLMSEAGRGAENKHVPCWVKNSAPEIIEAFISAAILGDGWIQQRQKHHKISRAYSTISSQLADDMQELFLKLEKASNIRTVRGKPWKIGGRSGSKARTQYHVYELHTQKASLDGGGNGKREFIGQKVQYRGMVYCATVPNGTLVCRRNGKSFIAGNCEVYANAAEQIYRPNYEKLRKEFATVEEDVPRRTVDHDMDMPVPRPRMSGSRWMSGFSKI